MGNSCSSAHSIASRGGKKTFAACCDSRRPSCDDTTYRRPVIRVPSSSQECNDQALSCDEIRRVLSSRSVHHFPSHMDRNSTPSAALLKHVLLAEILSVTSTMRKNSRWASSSLVVPLRDSPALGTNLGLRISSPNQTRLIGRRSKEAELIAGFIELKRLVNSIPGMRFLPFIQADSRSTIQMFGKSI